MYPLSYWFSNEEIAQLQVKVAKAYNEGLISDFDLLMYKYHLRSFVLFTNHQANQFAKKLLELCKLVDALEEDAPAPGFFVEAQVISDRPLTEAEIETLRKLFRGMVGE